MKQVEKLHEKLTKECGFSVWRDKTNLEKTESLESELSSNIKSSKVFLFCLTRKYYLSKNCKKELRYAINICNPSKPVVFLMLERLELSELGDIGFILCDYVYIQCYKSQPFENWPDIFFKEISTTIENNMPVYFMRERLEN